MALGMTEWSGALAPADVAGAGEMEWGRMVGIDPGHPAVGGPDVSGLYATDVDRGFSRVITTLPDAGGPATGQMAGAPGVHLLDDWRDLFNFKGSPMPWLLLFVLAMLGVMQLAVAGRVGPARASASVGK